MKNNKREKIELVVSIALLLLIVFSLSYAYFRKSLTESTQNDVTTLTCLNITYADKTAALNLVNEYPIPDSEGLEKDPYTFTITNNCASYVTLQIGVESLTTSTIDSSHIKASIIGEGGTPTTASLLTSNSVGTALNGGIAYILYTTSIDASSSQSYDLRLWLDVSTTASEASGKVYNGKIVITETAANKTKPNAPLLADNMIPVYYDNTNDVWIKANVKNANNTWYNYDNQVWANAATVLATSTTSTALSSGGTCTGTSNYCTRSDYVNAPIGTQIPMADILGMWVWIPRYEYMTTNLGTSYAGGTQALPGGISIKFISGTSTTNDSDYLIHPAFRNGNTSYTLPNGSIASNYSQGGWDKELTGFWIGKFETGYGTNTFQLQSTINYLSSNILIKPNVYSARGFSLSNDYIIAQNVQNDHGIGNTIETHMSKNDEWGAVAYLTQSSYGKYGNSLYIGVNKEIYLNNSMCYDYDVPCESVADGRVITTGRSSGSTSNLTSFSGSYEYNNCPASKAIQGVPCTLSERNSNQIKGTGASSTGNIYGVYDLVGGSGEYVMANLSGTIGSSGFSSMPSQKYWNKYTSTLLSSSCNGSPCYGQSIIETGLGENNGYYQWYNDYIIFAAAEFPWISRGGNTDLGSSLYTGLFSLNYKSGTADSDYSFRVSIS